MQEAVTRTRAVDPAWRGRLSGVCLSAGSVTDACAVRSARISQICVRTARSITRALVYTAVRRTNVSL